MTIRLLLPSDSISDLTSLIRRAYKTLADMGFNYTGSYQDDSETITRIKDGECYVMTDGLSLIGTITIHLHSSYYAGKNVWCSHPEVALLGQLAIDPQHQRIGLGSRLMDFAETRAAQIGASEVALDTAEGAEHLVRFYRRRGYRMVGYLQHEGKTYRSVVLSKTIGFDRAKVASPKG